MERTRCTLCVTAAASEHSLPAIVSVMRRLSWSIDALAHRERCDHHEVELSAETTGGRLEALIDVLSHEALVISVEPRPHWIDRGPSVAALAHGSASAG